jgi:dTDP-4-amino-4,6-dideoxygalactose transaminase
MIRLSKSKIGSKEIQAVSHILENEFLGMGREVQSFENALKEYIGGKDRQVVCLVNGTCAIQLALQAAGVASGDEVLVPSLTYVATYQAVSALGAIPVSCDVLEGSGFIDPAEIKKKITENTKAILPVHYASRMEGIEEVYEIANENNLRVVEDACHSFGSRDRGHLIGALGDMICFSFDGIKNITSGEGGAVVTGNKAAAEKIRDLRLLGVEKDTEKRFSGERSWDFDVKDQGWRYHMSNIMAAIGLVQLERFESEFKPKRMEFEKLYRQLLMENPGVSLFKNTGEEIVPHIMPVKIKDGKRDQARAYLLENGIQCGIHYKPNHLLTKYGAGQENLPVSERLYKEFMTLPLHADLSETEIHHITDILRRAINL